MLDHPAADKAPFGQAVRARTAEGGGWLGWVVAVDDLDPVEERIGRPPIEGQRHLPDGTLLTWQQLGVKDLLVDPQLPFFVQWSSDPAPIRRPAAGRSSCSRSRSPVDHDRVDEWLGGAARRGAVRHRHRLGGAGGPARTDRGGLQHAARRSADLSARDAIRTGGRRGCRSTGRASRPATGDGIWPPTSCPATRTPIPRCRRCWRRRRGAVAQMNRYPDMGNVAMTDALSERLGVPAGPAGLRHRVGGGALPPAAGHLRGRRRGGLRLAQLRGVPDRRRDHRGDRRCRCRSGPGAVHDLAAMRAAITPATRAVLLCTPEQPDRSGAAARATWSTFAGRGARGRRWWWSTRRTSSSSPTRPRSAGWTLVADRPNVVVLRTFSKAYGLAGFRVGYCVAAPELAARGAGGGAAVRGLGAGPGRGARLAGGRAGAAGAGRRTWSGPGTRWRPGCGGWASTCPTRRATSSGCRPGR